VRRLAGVVLAVGDVLSASTGSWSGTTPIHFAYRWQRCHRSCTNIAGATRSSYMLLGADAGVRVRVVVTASNRAGSAAAASTQDGPVMAALPTLGQVKASLSSTLIPTGRAAKIAILLKRGGYAFSFKALMAGRLVISWYLIPKGARITRSKPRPILVATGRLAFSKGSTGRTTLKLTSAGKKLLKNGEDFSSSPRRAASRRFASLRSSR
jgi:hypothetical protein